MRSTVLHAPGDVRVEDRADPVITAPTDAIIRLSATCVCGSDLWPYRGADPLEHPTPMGHEYVGIVEDIGSSVRTIKPGQFVIGSFFASDNTCPVCLSGYQSSCVHRENVGANGAQSQYLRVPLADGTLVATPACSPRPMCSAPDGSVRSPPQQVPARRLSWSVTEPSACSGSWPPNTLAQKESSR